MMKKTNLLIAAVLTILVLAGAGPAAAIDPIPEESGFSGFIKPGVGYVNFKSNMVASFLDYDFSKKKIDSLTGSPESQDTAIVTIPFSVEYTFASTRTQVFLGSVLGDIVRFDFAQQLGVKQEIGKYGILQGGILFSGIPARVWEDPYVVNKNRKDTDRKSNGLRLAWDKIFGSGLQLQYTYRKIEIDDENSGVFLGLDSAQRKLLQREGDRNIAEILYRFKLSEEHRLTPALIFSKDKLDGDAMSNDGFDFQLTYAYVGDPLKVVVNGFIGKADYDKRNPIYDKKQEDDRVGIAGEIFYKNPWDWRLFGSNPVNFFVNLAYISVDANIDFYDQDATLTSAGIFAKW